MSKSAFVDTRQKDLSRTHYDAQNALCGVTLKVCAEALPAVGNVLRKVTEPLTVQPPLQSVPTVLALTMLSHKFALE